ncbi:MAG: insulinase family protein [Lachnospiraceae bacterium]|nr:insulinase family protein [Lachnospiraceae bacterium]
MSFLIPEEYEMVMDSDVKEIKSEAVVLRHKKSGAKLFLLSNDDENKVFIIGFRTLPHDSTGVAHILEHSVLCGSEKFPVKDPFMELEKGSLNTFLNAMTYPDKTIYPVASCNDKDFQNLMDVYMDAVMNPNIYVNEKIFMQEGWHYEMEDKAEPLSINGVVYNEMKGAFSNADGVLDRRIKEILFPDTCYANESGGDPECIPQLTYVDFLNFHSRYYHPSNSYIYLYGDMDMTEKLEWLDKEYLSKYDTKEIDSEITKQKPFENSVEDVIEFSITEDEEEEDQYILSKSMVTGSILDKKLYIAFQILEYALLGAPGAPLKQALLDAGIGDDVYGGYDNGTLQTFFSVIAKNCRIEQKEQFLEIIDSVLGKMVDEGINRRALLAGINCYEFKYREGDYGSYPKGLMYGIQCFDSWLYDGEPLAHLEYEETFEFLKSQIDTGYFEELIKEYLLDNKHSAVVIAKPVRGLTEKRDELLAEKLADYKASLSEEEIDRIVKRTHGLKEYQDEPTPQELLEKIPLLSRSDIKRECAPIIKEEKEENGLKVIHTNIFTSKIGYLQLLFGTDVVAPDELVYLGLLRAMLGVVNTENYTYNELFNEIYIQTGGIGVDISSYMGPKTGDDFRGVIDISAKVLYANISKAFELIYELILKSDFTDYKRMYEIVAQTKARMQTYMIGSGHRTAIARAASYSSKIDYFSDCTSGISFYKFIDELEKNFDERKAETAAKLSELVQRIFTRGNLTTGYTADTEGYDMMVPEFLKFAEKLEAGRAADKEKNYELVQKNEGFKTSSMVQYVAQCGNFKKNTGLKFTGALRVLRQILSTEYLWINVRVKGGAYGCMTGFSREGESYFVSYRDPNLEKTFDVYKGIVDYVKSFDVCERDMTKYVIGTISGMDVPLNPAAKGQRAMASYMTGTGVETIQRERDEVLDADVQAIRALAPYIQAILDCGNICVVGNDAVIEKSKHIFNETTYLL